MEPNSQTNPLPSSPLAAQPQPDVLNTQPSVNPPTPSKSMTIPFLIILGSFTIIAAAVGGYFIGKSSLNAQDANAIPTLKQVSTDITATPFPSVLPTALPTAMSKAIVLSYALPAGWHVLKDPTNTFEVGIDSTSTQMLEAGVEGLNLTRKQKNADGIGFKSYMSFKLLPYDGSSRRQFIFDQLNSGQAPQKQDMSDTYAEKEYTFSGKSCLFFEGISLSQFPNVWGMCDAGGGKAFLITSYDPDYVPTLKTLRALQ